ncbi:TonB-dependent receptor [Cellvibrio sp. PSBB006]|uniref:TonB-dependent receptor n=1 Tax=Cellvibrio sp. PSBB006 TaxID=1987723 RepID=UPI000B3B2DB3|nr:TonB-dependent receptor [Cellvibrio sp. PSBB006]ARU27853.1 TonB-dependent receptor [Cellvibrio sp. PSBB006]
MFKRSVLSTSIAVAIAVSAQSVLAQEEADDSMIEEVVVTGIRASLTKGLDIKRNAYQIVDAIVAEDIGKFPDNNVVEALQRVSGIQVTDRGAGEVSKVAIRGLDDVTTTINGRNIFTASGLSVALQDIPASLLGRVDVYKTRSADLIETGIAGQIDIHTQRPFDFDGSKVVIAARGIYQEQSDEVDPNISALFSNRWETGAGEFGALLNISYAETNYRDQSVTAGAMMPFATDNPPAGWAPYEIIRSTDGRATEDPIWQPGLEAGLPFAPGSTLEVNGEEVEYLLSRDAIFASDFTGKRERPAANISLQFAPSETSEYMFEAFYNGYRDESFNSLLFSFVDWWGNLGDDPSSTLSLYDGTNIIKERTIGAPYNFTSGDLRTGETDSYVYALGGKWDITNNFELESELVYQTSEYNETFFAMRTERVTHEIDVDFNSGGGVPAFGFNDNPATADIDESNAADPSQWTINQLYDNGNKRDGDAITFTIDGDYGIDGGFVKNVSFGLRYDDRQASEAQRIQDTDRCGINPEDPTGPEICLTTTFQDLPGLVHINSAFFDGESDVPTSWAVADGHYIRSNADAIRRMYNEEAGANLALSDQLNVVENFNVDELTTAVYLQADFETEIAGRVLDGQFGVRYVSIDTDVAFTTGSVSTSVSKALPSLMVRYGITEDLIARFSYGETLRRAAFFQLNPTINYVEDVTNIGYGTATGGNPNLDPTESKNYDVSLEWYFSDSSSIYGTLFRREVEGFVVDFARRVTYEDYDYILTQPDNASNGELEGLELGVVYFPDNLPGILDGFGIQASYTALDSTQDIPITDDEGNLVGTDTTPLFGVSDSSYSVVLAYERDKFDARLSYVWRDDFLNNYEARQFANPLGIYRKAEESMDLQVSYDVTDNLVVTFDATNLTNELYQSYYEYPTTHNFGSSLYSRTFAVGARYSF